METMHSSEEGQDRNISRVICYQAFILFSVTDDIIMHVKLHLCSPLHHHQQPPPVLDQLCGLLKAEPVVVGWSPVQW